MTHDIHTLTLWIRVVTFIAAICASSVPIIYSFSAWRTTLLGRVFMLQAVSFAVVLDRYSFFLFWQPKNILIQFWSTAILLTFIAMSTAAMSFVMWRTNHPKKRKGRHWKK